MTIMDATENQLYDHSTCSGKIHGIVHHIRGTINSRCCKYVATLLSIFLIVIIIWAVYRNPVQDSPSLPQPTIFFTNSNGLISSGIVSNGTITFTGNKNNFSTLSDLYVQLQELTGPISLISIQNAIVNATKFSFLITKFSNTLREIYLNNVTIIGQFSRTYLPMLQEFCLNQVVNAERLERYQEKKYVHSVLFFDLIENNPWDIKNISNLGINIVFKVNGFKFIYVNQNSTTGRRELTVYVPYCNEILQNVKGSYEILSLATCSITKNVIPKNLEYLNFFDVNIIDGHISEILEGMSQLQYLFLDLPNTTIDISHIPKSLTCLSLSTIGLTYDKNTTDVALNSLDTLSLGFNSMDNDIYNNFVKIFPNVEHVAAFGLQSANYPLLESCYKSQVFWVLVEEFNHKTTTEDEKELQKILADIGITLSDVNFLIQRPKYSDSLIGMSLNSSQDYRFMLLGWYKFLTLEAYRNADKYVIEI